VRLVLDTNTVVSGLLWNNAPRRLIDAALSGRIELVTSPALLLELEDVLLRAKFTQKVAASRFRVAQLVARYAVLTEVVTPADISRTVPDDPDDDQVLACALAAGADLIVSGDADVLNLKQFHGIPIVSSQTALGRIAP